MQDAVRAINYVGSNTHTAAGIIEMYTNQFTQANGDRPNVENIAIIITDGVSTTNNQRTVPEAINARSRGIRIFSVGITTSVNEQELREMSSMPQIEGQTYWRSSDFTTLGDVIDTLVQETCGTPSPTPVQNLYSGVPLLHPLLHLLLHPPQPLQVCNMYDYCSKHTFLIILAQKYGFIYCVS